VGVDQQMLGHQVQLIQAEEVEQDILIQVELADQE
jgi:hypothetical protein